MGNSLDSGSPESLETKKGGLKGISDAQRQISGAKNKEKDSESAWEHYDVAEDAPEFHLDSPEGMKAMEKMEKEVPPEVAEGNPRLAKFMCEACLRFRRGDFETAKVRMQNYFKWRQKYLGGYEEQTIVKDPDLARILRTGLIRVIRNVDAHGRSAVVVQLKNNKPAENSALEVLRTWHYVVLRALQELTVQTNGVIVIGDMGGASFGNLDLRIPRAILGAIAKNVPLRLYRVCMIRPFMLLRILLPIMKAFMSEKIKRRLEVMPSPADEKTGLPKYIDMKQLPPELFGSNESYDFEKILESWISEERKNFAGKETGEGDERKTEGNGPKGDTQAEKLSVKSNDGT